jgi:Tol biopolymer transport system component
MDDPSTGAPPVSEPAPGGRLDSWKEIAAYLKRDVTTVQRWEKREGMPVRRHVHDKLGSVYAFRSDLDAWARGRSPRFTPDGESQAEPLDPALAEGPVVGEPAPAIASGASRWTPRARTLVGRAAALAAVAVLLAAAAVSRFRQDTGEPRNPIANARVRYLTDFGGAEHAAAISRDGRFVAFLSNRDGQADVWVTQVGTGQFHNLTRGGFLELVNPSVRTMGFSPDGDLVAFWTRRAGGSGVAEIGLWAVPTLGGEPRPYLEGVAEFDWSSDGEHLVYHTPGTGDPTFVREPGQGADRPILTAAPGLHAHFPLWSPDQSFIYFVQGALPGAMDVWRIRPSGGAAERVTHHDSRVSHPVMLDRRTLLYLACDTDGSGPWLYSLDTEVGVSRRVSSGMDRYTSLSASADGHHLVMTIANQQGTLWRMPLGDGHDGAPAPAPISLTTGSGFSPRIGPGYLLYVSSKGTSDSIWKLEEGRTTELWTAPGARIVGRPEIDRSGRRVAFSAEVSGRSLLYAMNADGTEARVVTASLDLRGAPAWAPGGASITSAVNVQGTPRLFAIALDGTPAPLVPEYSIDPVWAPDGAFIVYSGPDIGTTFPVKAVTANAGSHPLPNLTLTRGARRLRFFERRRALVVLRGDIQHKDLWLVDLETGAERRLTTLPTDFNVRDFDISPDGREIVLERVQEHSDVVLLETGAR